MYYFHNQKIRNTYLAICGGSSFVCFIRSLENRLLFDLNE